MTPLDLFKIFKEPENRKIHIVLVVILFSIVAVVFTSLLAPLLVEEFKDKKIFSNSLLPWLFYLVNSITYFFGRDVIFSISFKIWYLLFIFPTSLVVVYLLVKYLPLIRKKVKTAPADTVSAEQASLVEPHTPLPTSMEIDGILWTWKWRDSSRQEEDILDLKPLCPVHKYALDYVSESDDMGINHWFSGLHCLKCAKNLLTLDFSDKFYLEDKIKRLIVSELRTRFNY